MKILILCKRLTAYSNQRLKEEIEIAGHIPVLSDYESLSESENDLSQFQVVIPRLGIIRPEVALDLLQKLEAQGVVSLNSTEAIRLAKNKWESLRRLKGEGISIPKSHLLVNPQEGMEFLKSLGNASSILKLTDGFQGLGVMKAETLESAQSIIDAFYYKKIPLILQEFIQESEGRDLRLFVVAGEVVASMERVAKIGEFRSNLHRGGEGVKVIPTDEEVDLALRATKALGLQVAGVDLLRSKRGPLVLEVNASPGLEGIERVSGVNVARKMVELLGLFP